MNLNYTLIKVYVRISSVKYASFFKNYSLDHKKPRIERGFLENLEISLTQQRYLQIYDSLDLLLQTGLYRQLEQTRCDLYRYPC